MTRSPVNPSTLSGQEQGRVLVALSGGVDSSVAALRLLEEGRKVSAAYIRTWMHEDDPFTNCPAEQEIETAAAAAQHLGVPFEVVNLVAEYRERVVDYLVDGYRRGITPNPDVMCNREMKFGVFRDYAARKGFDGVATGHYVRKVEVPGTGFRILEGIDPNKDQSYFLALCRSNQLENACFPIGNMEKSAVRAAARAAGLPNADKKDSQGICFLGKVDIREFLAQFIPDRPGRIVRTDGTVLGEHRGLHRFTIGQRRGIDIPSNADHEFYVVVGKDLRSGDLIVAFESDPDSGLYTTWASVHGVSWIAGRPPESTEGLTARPRYRDPRQEMDWERTGPETARIRFHQPQRALASGQILAIYRDDQLLGGAVFD